MNVRRCTRGVLWVSRKAYLGLEAVCTSFVLLWMELIEWRINQSIIPSYLSRFETDPNISGD